MKIPTLIILAVLLGMSAAKSQESRDFLDYEIILDEEPAPYPFSYCSDNLPLSVESVELTGDPTRGQSTKLIISGESSVDTKAVTITELITLEGEKQSSNTSSFNATFESNKKYQLDHILRVNDTAPKGRYNCKISIQNETQSLTCIQINYYINV